MKVITLSCHDAKVTLPTTIFMHCQAILPLQYSFKSKYLIYVLEMANSVSSSRPAHLLGCAGRAHQKLDPILLELCDWWVGGGPDFLSSTYESSQLKSTRLVHETDPARPMNQASSTQVNYSTKLLIF